MRVVMCPGPRISRLMAMVERMQLLRRLERIMEETDFGWSLLMVGEDQSRKLADLTNDLKRPHSDYRGWQADPVRLFVLGD